MAFWEGAFACCGLEVREGKSNAARGYFYHIPLGQVFFASSSVAQDATGWAVSALSFWRRFGLSGMPRRIGMA